MLCGKNSKPASLSTAAPGQGVTWESSLRSTKGRKGSHGFQTSARSIFRFAQKVVTVVAGATFPSSQECPCPLPSLSILPEPSQISPDKAHYKEMRVIKKFWFQPGEKIKVNLLTADNINLSQQRGAPLPALQQPTHPGFGDCKQRTNELPIKTWGEMQRFWRFCKL